MLVCFFIAFLTGSDLPFWAQLGVGIPGALLINVLAGPVRRWVMSSRRRGPQRSEDTRRQPERSEGS